VIFLLKVKCPAIRPELAALRRVDERDGDVSSERLGVGQDWPIGESGNLPDSTDGENKADRRHKKYDGSQRIGSEEHGDVRDSQREHDGADGGQCIAQNDPEHLFFGTHSLTLHGQILEIIGEGMNEVAHPLESRRTGAGRILLWGRGGVTGQAAK
jgi:hypothetical protein